MDPAWTAIAGRLILGGFFLVAGIGNLVATGSIRDHIERMRGFGTPAPEAAFWSGIALQFLGAALVLSGIRADIGALAWSRSPRSLRRSSIVSGNALIPCRGA